MLQVEALRASAEEEFRRRLGLERTLHEAASLFRRELSGKSAEMRRLQGQVHRMRRLSGVAAGAAGLAAGVTLQSVQQPLSAAASPCTHAGSQGREDGCCVAAHGVCCSSPHRGEEGPSASPLATAVMSAPCLGSPSTCGGCSSCSPTRRGVGGGGGDLLSGELAALRAARGEYASAVLEQDRLRNSLLSSLGETLRAVREATSSAGSMLGNDTCLRGRGGMDARSSWIPHFPTGKTLL